MRLMNPKALLIGLLAACVADGRLAAQDIPAGREVRVRLADTIDSATAKQGQRWGGWLIADLIVDGRLLARRGAAVTGTVVEVRESGRLANPGFLRIALTSIENQPVKTTPVVREATGHGKRNAGWIAVASAAGAAIGAAAGGGKGAAAGAAAGAGAGTVGAAATGKKDVRFNVEEILTFRVTL